MDAQWIDVRRSREVATENQPRFARSRCRRAIGKELCCWVCGSCGIRRSRFGSVSTDPNLSPADIDQRRWSKVRPSISETIRVRCIAGVPPAMAQPCASRCKRSRPYSSV